MIVEQISVGSDARLMGGHHRLVVSEAEAASMLNMARRTLQGKRLDGSGPPFVQLSDRRIGYAMDALQDWIRSRSVRSTSNATVRRIGEAR
ncbi:helix-turn-helix transcriptional regulator [Tanticharoenia sakaeratensis]|nr:hypothetical protein [Tanticharoenia sakaeratensis]